MEVYNSLLLFCVICVLASFGKTRLSVWTFGLSALLMTLSIILRDEYIGTDTIEYYHYFMKPKNGYNSQEIEIGFELYTRFVRFFTDNGNVIIAITGLLSLMPMFYFIGRYSKNKALSVFLFMTLGTTTNYYILYMSMVRQCLSVGMYLVALIYFYQHIKTKKTYAITLSILLIAVSIHHATALFLPIIFLEQIKFKTKYVYAALGGSFFIGIISKAYSTYFQAASLLFSSETYNGYDYYVSLLEENTFQYGVVVPLTLLCAFVFAINDKTQYNDFFFKVFAIGVIANNAISLLGNSDRFSLYTIPMGCVVIVNSIYNCKQKIVRAVIVFVLLGYYSAKYQKVFDNAKTNPITQLVPYKSVFD